MSNMFTVPVSIEAKSQKELTEIMLMVQSRLNSKVHFFDINFVKGKWIAWYELDMMSQLIKENDV